MCLFYEVDLQGAVKDKRGRGWPSQRHILLTKMSCRDQDILQSRFGHWDWCNGFGLIANISICKKSNKLRHFNSIRSYREYFWHNSFTRILAVLDFQTTNVQGLIKKIMKILIKCSANDLQCNVLQLRGTIQCEWNISARSFHENEFPSKKRTSKTTEQGAMKQTATL